MKAQHFLLKLFIALGFAFTAAVAFGQTTYTWTGTANGTNFATAGNWNPSGPPGSGTQDIGQWDGVTTSNLVLYYNGGIASGFGTYGIQLVLTPNQTNSVQIVSPVPASPNFSTLPISGIINSSAASGFSLGDTNANYLNVIWRPGNADELHVLENNSTSPAIIYSNVRFQSGGGVAHILSFGGTGDWNITNNLVADVGTIIQKNGSGTLFWNGPSRPLAWGSGTINSPVTIAGGTVVLQNNTVLSPAGVGTTGTQNIENNGGRFKYDAPSLTQTLTGVISGTGILEVANGTLILSGNNTYGGGTMISGGILQIGNGGTNGSLGIGPVTNNATLIFNRSDKVTISNVVSGTGSVVQQGTGALWLNGVNIYTGSTTVSNGTLGGTGTLSGPVTLTAGTTLAPGSLVGTLTINNDLSIGGNLAIEVNKLLLPSNDFVVVAGVLTNMGVGTLTVANLGPALAVGDKFTLFNQPMQNGAALTVNGAGVNWVNNLAVDGSIAVSSIISKPRFTSVQLLGESLVITGTNGNVPGTFYYTLVATNLSLPLTSWTVVATNEFGSDGGFRITNSYDSTQSSQFFMLRLP